MGRHTRAGHAKVAIRKSFVSFGGFLFIAILFKIGIFDVGNYSVSNSGQFLVLGYITVFFQHLLTLNLILAVFNLLPMAPLDGSGVLRGLVPQNWLPALKRIETIGPLVLMGIFILQAVMGVRILGYLLAPVLNLANRLIGSA